VRAKHSRWDTGHRDQHKRDDKACGGTSHSFSIATWPMPSGNGVIALSTARAPRRPRS
jgi:hypothetical protein